MLKLRKFIACIIFVTMMVTNAATACIVDIATATTKVFVRSIEDDHVVGSLYKGDAVVVTGERKGWLKIKIGDEEYKTWGKYYTRSKDCIDVVNPVNYIRKSKLKSEGFVSEKKSYNIKGSDFEGIIFWK